jgi:hypothetical protein
MAVVPDTRYSHSKKLYMLKLNREIVIKGAECRKAVLPTRNVYPGSGVFPFRILDPNNNKKRRGKNKDTQPLDIPVRIVHSIVISPLRSQKRI